MQLAARHDALGTGDGRLCLLHANDLAWTAVLTARADLAEQARREMHLDQARALRDTLFPAD